MDGIAHRLRTAPEVFGYPRRMFSSGAGKKDLGSAQHERIGGAQALLEDLVLLFGKRTDENWRFHDHYCSALHTTYLGCALADGRLGVVVGDATGKGVPAALMMASTRSTL